MMSSLYNFLVTNGDTTPRLVFTTDSTFTILQLSDLHLGENSWTDWGPKQDLKTWNVLDTVIPLEQPNLIVLSGDQLTANNVENNASAYYHILASKLSAYRVPFAMIFGNHDDMPFEDPLGNGTSRRTETSRRQLFDVLSQYTLSLTQVGPKELPGVSNYWLDVFGENQVAMRVLLLDSGGGTLRQQITLSQVDWFQRTHLPQIPTVAFQHIPTIDFQHSKERCNGSISEGRIAPLHSDGGMIAALSQAHFHFLAVGHNHGNDYCCAHSDPSTPPTSSNLYLCFGRHSGYGGYNRGWSRGARVYHIRWNDHQTIEWTSHVRLETGEVVSEYDPTTLL